MEDGVPDLRADAPLALPLQAELAPLAMQRLACVDLQLLLALHARVRLDPLGADRSLGFD